MITLSQAQAGRIVDALTDAIAVSDSRLNAHTVLNEQGSLTEDEADGMPDLLEENEQLVRLRELVLSHLGKAEPFIWECPDEGCAWLNRLAESLLCEQCGHQN